MKIVLVTVAGLAVGLLAGAGLSGVRVKAEILEQRAIAAADSAAARAAVEEHDESLAYVESDTVEASPVDTLAPEHTEVPADDASQPAGGSPLVQASLTLDGGVAQAPDTGTAPEGEAPADPSVGQSAPAQVSPTASDGRPDWAAGLNADGAKKLSKIFAAMKPQDAAEVLVGMSDDEVKAILLQMSDRQAGPIVGAFPPDRAASLSRDVLRTPRAGGGS